MATIRRTGEATATPTVSEPIALVSWIDYGGGPRPIVLEVATGDETTTVRLSIGEAESLLDSLAKAVSNHYRDLEPVRR